MILVAEVRRVRCAECGDTFCIVNWTENTLGSCPDCGLTWFLEIEEEEG